MKDLFSLTNRAVIITGAAGLLGRHHAWAVAHAGGLPILVDIDRTAVEALADEISARGLQAPSFAVDVTLESSVNTLAETVMHEFGPVWGLVNNVAANPPMSRGAQVLTMESTAVDDWESDMRLGVTAAWLCGRAFGQQMAAAGGGSIVNVASDLAVIAPDHRVYLPDALEGSPAPKKPASYVASKGAIRAFSRYLATYWSPLPVRSNCLIPGSALGRQSPALVAQLEERIPLGRLAEPGEYRGAVVFLLSDASSYMTGADLVIDGGRSAW